MGARECVHLDADLLFDLYMALGQVLTPNSFVACSCRNKGRKVVAGLANIRY